MQQREAVWAEALTWQRTPWRHRQCVKGHGVDCGRLLIACYAAAGVIPEFEPPPYDPDWNMHRTEERFLGLVRTFGHEIDEAEAGVGDTVVFKYGLTYSHGAILGPGSEIVHAYRTLGGKLFEGIVQRGDWKAEEDLKRAPRLFFSPKAWRS